VVQNVHPYVEDDEPLCGLMGTVTINMDLRMDEEVRANVEEETLFRVQLVQDDEQDNVVGDGKQIPLDALEIVIQLLYELFAMGGGRRRIAAHGLDRLHSGRLVRLPVVVPFAG
jgi:hypothetical protein